MHRFVTFSMVMGTMLSALSCADEPPTLGLTVTLYVANSADDPFDGVSWLRVSVEGDGIVPGSYVNEAPFEPNSAISVPFAPYGTNRQVVVEGWAAGDDGRPSYVLSRGTSVPVSVMEGAPQQTLGVQFSRVNALATLTDQVNEEGQSLQFGRIGHAIARTATGEILVTGGATLVNAASQWWSVDGYESLNSTIEIIDEQDHKVRMHPTGMYLERVWHTATALYTGQVLLAGGYAAINGQREPTGLVEVYYPGDKTRVDVLANQLSKPRVGHTATLIDEDSFFVLMVGGDVDGAGTYEVWSPEVGSSGPRPLPDGFTRSFHTATVFDVPGRPDQPAILITGGLSTNGPLDTALVYDPVSDSMIPLASTMGVGRMNHTATFVPGRDYVYIAGGYLDSERTQISSSIDVYFAAQNTMQTDQLALKDGRAGHAAVSLPGNSVLMTGGVGLAGPPLESVEVIHEYLDVNANTYVIDVVASEVQTDGTVVLPYLAGPRVGQQVVVMGTGVALLVGGAQLEPGALQWTMPTDLTVYNPQ